MNSPAVPAKIDVGNTLSEVFNEYGKQAGTLIPAALVIFVPLDLLVAVAAGSGGLGAVLIALLLGVVGSFWYVGIVISAVQDMRDGRRDSSIGDLFRESGPYIGKLLAAGLLAGLGIALGLVLLIVPGLILLTWWAVVAPVIVLERTGVIDAFGRSRQLVRGNGWGVFGVLVVLFLLAMVAGGVLQGILSAAGDFVGAFIGQVLTDVLIAPLQALAAAIIYFQLRGVEAAQPAAAQPPAAPVPPAGPPAAGAAPDMPPPPPPQEGGPPPAV